MVPCQKIKGLPSDQAVLWDRLLESTPHPLHRSRASELFLEVLALQEGGTEIDWPSVYCAITTLTRLDKDCLQARLAVGCSELEFRWMLHDRHLYTVHKVPVRFQRCLACMVAKQGPCGDHKATWLCRSRLTDAPPGVDVQNAHCLRPSRQRAYQMTDPHNKKSSSSGPGRHQTELISMYDSHTWPETRRSETFHSQASKLWEFVTEELSIEDPVELWEIVSRACSKRYLLMMAKLWHRASVPEDRIAMDSYVLHTPEDLPSQACTPAAEDALSVQPLREREGREGSWMYPTHAVLAHLRVELDLDESRESSDSSDDCRYKRPWHWLPEMSSHPKWCKMVLPKPLKLKRSAQDSLETSSTPLLSQELSRRGRKRRLTSAMTDMLQSNSSQSPQPHDDPPFELRSPPRGTPQRPRAPSKRAHARRASELLSAQLVAENQEPDQETAAAAPAATEANGSVQQTEMPSQNTPDSWQPRDLARRLSHRGSSNTLSPSTSTSLTHFGSSDFGLAPSTQLTSPVASGLSINSTSTNQGFSYLGNNMQAGAVASPPAVTGMGGVRPYAGPNPMTGQEWLPQGPVRAAHLGQVRNEPKVRAPVDFMDGMWGFEDFPPIPGNIDGSMDGLGTLDFHSRSGHHFAPQQHDSMIMAHHHALPIASNNALAGNLAAGFSHYFGHI